MGEWIPLMDYAMKKGVSLSTLRRHIKANKIQYRVENGRYLLFVEENGNIASAKPASAAAPAPKAASAPRVSAPSQGSSAQVSTQAQASAPSSASVNNVTPPKMSDGSDDYLLSQLQAKLKKAQEEIAELKTLIAFYEESLGLAKNNSSAAPFVANRFNG
jgi:hypothetical protein